jgi:hypothetical protein
VSLIDLFARVGKRPCRPDLLRRFWGEQGKNMHANVINDQPRVIADSFAVPDEALDLVPGQLRHAARENKVPSIPEEMLR